MAGSLSLIVKLFEEFVADNLPQGQLLVRGVDDEATLLLLVPWAKKKKKMRSCEELIRKYYILTSCQKTSEVTFVCQDILSQFWDVCFLYATRYLT